jgi:hypothetical protein
MISIVIMRGCDHISYFCVEPGIKLMAQSIVYVSGYRKYEINTAY